MAKEKRTEEDGEEGGEGTPDFTLWLNSNDAALRSTIGWDHNTPALPSATFGNVVGVHF